MSFIEQNKTWILPVLAIGAAAVVWINVRTFSGTPPPPPQEPLVETQVAQTAQPLQPAPPAPSSGEANLWEDLLPLAFVPTALEARASFEHRALTALTRTDLDEDAAALPVGRPAGEPGRPLPRPQGTGPAPAPAAPAFAPQLDFVIEGPEGPRAWFAGRGYRPGQTLHDQPFLVQGIRFDPAPQVVLKGSGGLSTRSTHPSPPSKELH